MNDESTRANRAQAFQIGFLVDDGRRDRCSTSCRCSTPVGGREAIHVLMTIGIATALLRFGLLERRALRDG